MDRQMNDQPPFPQPFQIETSGITCITARDQLSISDQSYGDINVSAPSFNFTDPMDPEVCCDEPKQCMCNFGCIGEFFHSEYAYIRLQSLRQLFFLAPVAAVIGSFTQRRIKSKKSPYVTNL